jgi:Mrp family chromosome partitioning ATPase
MARIRDILRQADGHRQAPPFPTIGTRPCAAPSALRIVAETSEETPFIEVGAPGGAIDASPSVRAVPIPAMLNLSIEPPRVSAAANHSAAILEKPHGIVFRAIPPEPATLPVPAQRFAAELFVFHQPDHPTSAQYRRVLAGLKAQLPAAQAQILLFTTPDEDFHPGKLVLNLAIARVREGLGRIVVVDADLRTHELASLVGLPAEPGLANVLAGTTSLRRAVQETGFEGLDLLAAGAGPQDPAGLLAGQAMHAVLRHLRDRYRWVLVSAPPWDGRPDIVALATACDAVYLVTPHEADELTHVIPRQGGVLRGCIIVGESTK